MKLAAFHLALCCLAFLSSDLKSEELRLIEVDPGHFHAAQLHRDMLAGFSVEAHVYAPLGADLTAHLDNISRYNNRPINPTHWILSVYAGPDFLEKMRQEPPGNVVILSGRNRKKIDYILATLQSGQNVLADKPWIIEARDLPKLKQALTLAEHKNLIAYDCMTQRFDIAYQLERELVSDPAIFGRPAPGSQNAPSVRLENKHALLKYSSNGAPNRRPAWYFDIRQQGEGIADVGTHLVDLAQWTLFPDQSIDFDKDIRLLQADRWPTILTSEQFERITGESAWPDYLNEFVQSGRLSYFSNNSAVFSIKGIHVSLRVQWDYEAAPGTHDSYLASYEGSRSRIELRQGAPEHYVSELYITPRSSQEHEAFLAALRRRLDLLQPRYPGLSFEQNGTCIHILIPSKDRVSDEQYFSLLAARFLGYVRKTQSVPAWENANMLSKYSVTTEAVALARGERP